MSEDQILSTYEAVSELTGQMLTAAQSGDWEHLALLESRCAGHVRTLREGEPAVPLAGERRLRKVALIRQVLAHDREIRALTEPWMAHLAALMRNSGTARKLAVAYDQR